MECKFLQHGMAIGYDQAVKPCCNWLAEPSWTQHNHHKQIDISAWHQTPQVLLPKKLLEQNHWPAACGLCEKSEQQGRQDSMRHNGAQAYSHYQPDDITLEIRPGSVCNFACQTCWPEASSRVAQYHSQAGLIDIKKLESQAISNFNFLMDIKHRIRDVILLGGEPFYDPNCKEFLRWARHNLNANITMFTNGSSIDWDWVDLYPGSVTMVFSIDAINRPAEYIRFGTIWSEVEQNFRRALDHPRIRCRVNITASVYNYLYINDVIEFLLPAWPEVVSFGTPRLQHLLESVIPPQHRANIVDRLQTAQLSLARSNVEINQRHNAINALKSVIRNLHEQPWDQDQYRILQGFVTKMDQVKKINVSDFCPELGSMLAE
jgi:sulfatase maturation enzyme AslB (radical SAM superfamily)